MKLAAIFLLLALAMTLTSAATVIYKENFYIEPQQVLSASDLAGNYSIAQKLTPGRDSDVVIWGTSKDANINYWLSRRLIYGENFTANGSDVAMNTSFPEAPQIATIVDHANSPTGILYRQTFNGNQSIILLIINAEEPNYFQNVTIESGNTTSTYPEIRITATPQNQFLVYYTKTTNGLTSQIYAQIIVSATGSTGFLFNRLMSVSGSNLVVSSPSCDFLDMNNTYMCTWHQDNGDSTADWMLGRYDLYGTVLTGSPGKLWTNDYTGVNETLNVYVQTTANLISIIGENATAGSVVAYFTYQMDEPTVLAEPNTTLSITNNTVSWSDRYANGIFIGYQVSFSSNTTVIEKYIRYNQLGYSIGPELIIAVDGSVVTTARTGNDSLVVGVLTDTNELYVGALAYSISSAVRNMVACSLSIFLIVILVFGF